MDYSNVLNLALELGFNVYENEPLCTRTTFKIGGPADLLIECQDTSKLPLLLKKIKDSKTPLSVMGNGSNLLVCDSGIKGVVLVISEDSVTVSGDKIVASAGAKLSKLCNVALENGLSGLEFGFGIPGTVGGAVYMNAGAYGGEIKQVITSVTSITRNGEIITRTVDELELGYRTSIFKREDEVILSAEFELQPDEKETIKSKMYDFLCRRKDKQPLEFPSAGSTFKRP
ncbi:MAG: UDP-N-acetylmuramate dehydrogenase, partial [Clostridia bacterium]|nr:UDP-N-acetylmuramate dehydrogenase [Clostridia bacterium]